MEIKDATKCRVIKYSSNAKEIFSWEAEMLRTESFDQASKKFRSFYNSLHHLSVEINGAYAVFKGEYIQLSESIKFTSIVFDVGDKTSTLEHVRIALVLETEMLE